MNSEQGLNTRREGMQSSLDLVFRYRTLMGKCESGVGLDFEEIDLLTQIEAAFASNESHKDGRRWKRVSVDLGAMVRGGDLNDKVKVAACFQCHKSRAASDYLFTWDRLKAFAAK